MTSSCSKSPYAHDISVPEILLPLFLGGRMIIAEPDGHRDPNYLVDLVKREAVSVIHFVPTMLAEFVLVADQHRPIEIKHVFVGGEGLTRELAQQVLSFPGWTLHNLYGTTEASDYSTAWDVDLADTAQICPIGRPIYNVRLYVLGPDNEPRPVGIPANSASRVSASARATSERRKRQPRRSSLIRLHPGSCIAVATSVATDPTESLSTCAEATAKSRFTGTASISTKLRPGLPSTPP